MNIIEKIYKIDTNKYKNKLDQETRENKMYPILKNVSTISQLFSIVDLIESCINFVQTLLGIFNEDLIK